MSGDQSLYVNLPWTDALLRLTPRWGGLNFSPPWSGWELVAQVAGLAAAALVPLALIVWLYRYEMRLVKGGPALCLLLLRSVVILFLWFILCMQPVLTTDSTQEIPTRVMVALDVSGSMSATDADRPPAEKLKLARALRLPLPGGQDTDKLVDDWIKQYGKKGGKATEADIRWVSAKKPSEDADEQRQLAERRRALHKQVCDEVDRLTRLEIGLRLLAADGGRLLKGLSDKHRVDILGFDQKVVDFKPEKLDRVLAVLQALKPADRMKALELKPEQAALILHLDLAGLDKLRRKVNALKAAHKEAGWTIQTEDLDGLLRGVEDVVKLAEAKGLAAGKQIPATEVGLTDLNPPLQRSLKPSAEGQGRLIGVVLLSDGRQNAGASPARIAERLGKRQVPIYPVVLGTAYPRPSVSITEVQAPSNASAENVEVTIRVRFKVTGLKKQHLVVNLERADQREGLAKVPPRTIEHNGDDRYYTENFVVHMDPDGKPLQAFTVAIKPEKDKPKAGHLSQQVVIKMDETKPRVLVVDGEARWEYHYLANALARDPGLELQRVLFEPPLREPDVSDRVLRKMGNPQRQLPQGPDALAAYQCIILGDVSPEQLPLKDRRRLEEFVSKHGGTLIIVAGKRFTPLAYTALRVPALPKEGEKNIGSREELDPLLKLLPIEQPRVVKTVAPEQMVQVERGVLKLKQGFRVTLTREGKLAPFMHMEAEAVENEKRWAEFPPHYWAIIGRAKPAAITLAYFRDPARPVPNQDRDREDEVVRMSREQALIARHTYGRGQVLFVGLDSTWRWRYRIGDTYHHRFWGQVIRWAASDYVRFGTDKPVYQEGQKVDVSLSLDEKEMQAIPAGAEFKTRVIRLAPGEKKEEKLVSVITLAPSKGRRVLRGHVPTLEAGQYRIELVPPDPSLKLKLGGKGTSTFLVTPRDNKEMDRLETDEDQLRALARESGSNRLFTPVDAGKVVELLTKRHIAVTQRYERGLWQEWLTLVLFLVLMTAEWVGRKWAGLP